MLMTTDAHLQSLQLAAVQEVLQQAAVPVATEHTELPQTIAVVGAQKRAEDVQAHEASNQAALTSVALVSSAAASTHSKYVTPSGLLALKSG